MSFWTWLLGTPRQPPELVVLGLDASTGWGSRPYAIPADALTRHLSVFGASGSGKSTAAINIAYQVAAHPSRRGLLVVDVKDQLVSDVALTLPQERRDDVLLFDVADTAFPPALNPFAGVPEELWTLAVSETVTALRRLFADNWGVRLEHVLRMVCLTLIQTPEATLLDIQRILTDERYRSWSIRHVTNFMVQRFWEHEFPAIVGKNNSTANTASILNKLSIFAYPEIRNCVGQSTRGLDLRQAMDEGKIILCSLPQGVLGEDASSFLAALLIAKVTVAAQSRVTLPQQARRPFIVLADEMQNYATTAFEKAVTEGRSMGLGVITCCQFPQQLSTQLRLTLEKNCAHQLTCQRMQDPYGREQHAITVVPRQDPNAELLTKQLRALPPLPRRDRDQLAAIRERSRQVLGRPRAAVERELTRRMGGVSTDDQREAASAHQHQPERRHDDLFFEPEEAATG